MLDSVVILVVLGLGEFVAYTALLWIMIRVQKLNYHLGGLLISSFVATGISHIPVVGPYVAWAVLVLCLWKCTGAEIIPDVFFTVTIASALMFCVNLFVIGSLMGDLRMDLALGSEAGDDESLFLDDEGEEMEGDAELEAHSALTQPAVATAPVRSENRSGQNLRGSIGQEPAPAAEAAPAVSAAGGFKDPRALPTKLTLKGVTLNAAEKLAMISAGKSLHTIAIGESFSIPAKPAPLKLTCEDITQSAVILSLEAGERVKLTFF